MRISSIVGYDLSHAVVTVNKTTYFTKPLFFLNLTGNVAALTNAQLAAHAGNPAALANHLKQQQQPGAGSLQNPPSLTATSINPMLQKQLAQVGKQPSPQVCSKICFSEIWNGAKVIRNKWLSNCGMMSVKGTFE